MPPLPLPIAAGRPTVAVTLGDPAGIGPEIVARSLLLGGAGGPDQRVVAVAIGDPAALRRGVAAAGLTADVVAVDSPAAARALLEARGTEVPSAGQPDAAPLLPCVDIGVLGADVPAWGRVDARAGAAAARALEVATAAAMAGEVAAVVTAPLHKEALWAAGVEHLGHTEMLQALTGAARADTMFLVHGREAPHRPLRIFFTTRHASLRKALDTLDRATVVASITAGDEALRVLGVGAAGASGEPDRAPRIAVAAVNPHGGEGGAFGDEEIVTIGPAVRDAQALGVDAFGPVPVDAVFHQVLEGAADAVLCHTHDHGHIAAKTYDFHGTVSVTVGLPIIRTSVDHGTAFDIAGTGRADHRTMAAAIRAAGDLAGRAAAVRAAWTPAPHVGSGDTPAGATSPREDASTDAGEGVA